jgi:hypothetical protein
MAKTPPTTASTLGSTQDEIPTVRPPQSGWHERRLPESKRLRPDTTDALWQLVCDVMRAEADEALWGMRR